MPPQTSSFFTLPRELRDEVYGYLLPFSQPVPSLQSLARQTFEADSTHYAHRMCGNSIVPLALANRQIYFEVEDVTQRIATSKALSKVQLDVAMFGQRIFLTFTHLPFSPHFFPKAGGPARLNLDMDVNLRVGDTSLFFPEDANRYQHLWLKLGEIFFEGPEFRPYVASSRRPIKIDNLDMKMVFLDVYTPSTHMQCAMNILADLRMTASCGLWDGYVDNISFQALRQSEEESEQYLMQPAKIQMSGARSGHDSALTGPYPI
ncbi:hypothetical protein K431DRAFT_287571 [Polychaeton citri CBS 116435]|uniref:F-box domain-containing protein n=1 Tax=Polychaeton citri CBS 116435 TaxID=1314669 RepID=A0A9P4Q5T4_9PEZI|nr:hypothetical protein K431DRAFT_287571 [Polychaeton citri CBS 116435]